MNEFDDRVDDQTLIDALKKLVPAPVQIDSRRGTDEGPINLGIESLLYEAGFQAGRLSALERHQVPDHQLPAHVISTRLPPLSIPWALSLFAALLLLPVAFGLGRGSVTAPIDEIASQEDIADRSVETSNGSASNAGPRPQGQSIVDQIDVGTNVPAESIAAASAAPAIETWQTQRRTTVAPKETLTAFYRPTVESLPRSHWIAGNVDPPLIRTPLSVFDLEKLSFEGGVNQR